MAVRAGSAIAAALFFAGSAVAQQVPANEIVLPAVKAGPQRPPPLPGPDGKLKGHFEVIRYSGKASLKQRQAQAAAARTIPLWSSSITVGGVKYDYQMVGTDPVAKPVASKVKTVIVPVKFIFQTVGGGTLAVNDPSARNPACSPAGTPLKLTQGSPIFKSLRNFTVGGTNIGTGQFASLFQRANFWKYVQNSKSKYQVTLSPVVTTKTMTVTIQGGAPLTSTGCGGKLGYIEMGWWRSYVEGTLFPQLAKLGHGPGEHILFLLADVVMYDTAPNNCCTLGFHGSFDNPNFGNAFQTYSVNDYDTSRLFGGSSDVSILSHEIAEWMNDPAGRNLTPSWGNIGQVKNACQNNLEVGDPLSDKPTQPVAVGKVTYHVQDLAFVSWFYDQSPSIGLAAGYSLYGGLKQPAATCHFDTKLIGTGSSGASGMGASVALSSDGNTAIAGGPEDNGFMGAAWVFTHGASGWIQQGEKLTGSGASTNQEVSQGASVALSADGNTAIVGGPYDNASVGAAWVFARSNGAWTQQGAKLVGYDWAPTSDVVMQGSSVALSGDGNTAIVGDPSDGGNSTGAVWVFTRSNSAWTQQGPKLVGSGAVAPAGQGVSVSLSADGNTAIIGGPVDNGGAGAVWIFVRANGVWTQQGPKLVGSGAVGPAGQGMSVSLSADGNIAIVGGPADSNAAGATWVFTRSNGVWLQQGAKLIGKGALGPAFQGNSVSLSADGNAALVGGPSDNNNAGATWVFTRSGAVWTEASKLLGHGAAANGSHQGASVSLSGDSNTAIVGGPTDSYNPPSGGGAAWIFQ